MKATFIPAVLAAVSVILTVQQAAAKVRPEQVLVLANAKSQESLKLAKFYAKVRHIPHENILALNCPLREDISRSRYNHLIAEPLRRFISQRRLAEKIKVIVTVYGIPLKVGPAKPTARQRRQAQELSQRYRRQFAKLENLLEQFNRLAGTSAKQTTTLSARDNPDRFAKQLSRISAEFDKATSSILQKLRQQSSPQAKQALAMKIWKLRTRLQGLRNPKSIASAPDGYAQRYRQLEARFRKLLVQEPTERDLELCYRLADQLGGQLLSIKTIGEDIARLTQKHSQAAVDSELTLVMHRKYMLAGRMPNRLNPRLTDDPFAASFLPVFMVARLDGPTPKIVERMIRDAIATEATGLVGRAYIDARGLKNNSGLGLYDRDLIQLAHIIREKTDLPMTLDRRSGLFPPNSCPETALYCGWYSLKNYIPAFQFVPGAVAFHIASFEAISLHDPNLNLWCPKLLAAGATATIGPVSEPYVDAFPPPSEFFALLLGGKHCLVEAFFMTKRYNSWRMILLGDPLYRPFAANPQTNVPLPKLTPLTTPLSLIP